MRVTMMVLMTAYDTMCSPLNCKFMIGHVHIRMPGMYGRRLLMKSRTLSYEKLYNTFS